MDLSQILKLLCFNSRSHGGSDYITHLYYILYTQFQLTLPRRERFTRFRYHCGALVVSTHAPA